MYASHGNFFRRHGVSFEEFSNDYRNMMEYAAKSWKRSRKLQRSSFIRNVLKIALCFAKMPLFAECAPLARRLAIFCLKVLFFDFSAGLGKIAFSASSEMVTPLSKFHRDRSQLRMLTVPQWIHMLYRCYYTMVHSQKQFLQDVECRLFARPCFRHIFGRGL